MKQYQSLYALNEKVDYCPKGSILVYKNCKIVSIHILPDKEFEYDVFYDLEVNDKIIKNVNYTLVGRQIILNRGDINSN